MIEGFATSYFLFFFCNKYCSNTFIFPFISIQNPLIILSQASAAAAAKIEDALTSSICDEFEICSKFTLFGEYDSLKSQLATAKKARDMPTLKKLTLAIKNLGDEGKDDDKMDEVLSRLSSLLSSLNSRYDSLDDLEKLEIITTYIDKTQVILDTLQTKSLVPSSPSSPFVTPFKSIVSSGSFACSDRDMVFLSASLSEGENSSGKSIVQNGVYSPANTSEKLTAKVKMLPASDIARAQREYEIMTKLHKHDPSNCFLPHAFLRGDSGQITTSNESMKRNVYPPSVSLWKWGSCRWTSSPRTANSP